MINKSLTTKITFSFSMLIFLFAILFASVTLIILEQTDKIRIDHELKSSFNKIENYFQLNGLKFDDETAYELASEAELPYYITYTVYNFEDSNILFSNDFFIPVLPVTADKRNESKNFFSKNFYTDGDLNIVYYSKQMLLLDIDTIYLQVTVDKGNQPYFNSTIRRIILWWTALAIPFVLVAFIIARTYVYRIQKLQKDYEREQRFTSDVSHELKTPLAVILGHTNLLRRWGKNDPKILQDSLESIHSEAVSMKKLIDNLLLLARTDNGRYAADNPINRENIHMLSFFTKVKEDFSIVSPEAVFTIECGENDYFNCDRNILSEVMRIIITNSIKYSDENAKITLKYEKGVISEADKGRGISQTDIPRIFDRFYRTDESRNKKTGGTGLGLAIAKNLLALCEKTISCQSEPGKGTTIFIK